jgi:hypothetical protein
MHLFLVRLKYIQEKLSMKLKLDVAKFDYLKAFWNKEMEEYRHELIWSKNNAEKVLLKQFENY